MELITNRTSLDVERWKALRDKGWAAMTTDERREWLGEILPTPAATKGMYTHNDLNRVESAVEAILERFEEAGYKTPKLNIKTNWTYQDAFWRTDMERYYSNIAAIRDFLIVYPDTPKAPSLDKKIDFNVANDIEKILSDVYEIVTNLTNSWYYTGEVFSGEV